jgi:hypothetical protein
MKRRNIESQFEIVTESEQSVDKKFSRESKRGKKITVKVKGIDRKKMNYEKIGFSQENAAENSFKVDTKPGSDTMLGNMTSIDEGEKGL